jgi:curli biogenesis system outer membrane secretion channel CsgG
MGATKAAALNAALKQAVSQVFGEQFQAETSSFESIISAEITDSSGQSEGAALETSAMNESIRSKTKGIIHSYSIISMKKNATGFEITLKVNLAKYDKGLDASKKSIVILQPQYRAKNTSIAAQIFTESLQDAVENKLSKSKLFNILDRENLSDLQKEMHFISKNGDMSEIARIGNMAGADLIVISTVKKYSPTSKDRKVGNRIVTSSMLNAIISVKVVDPATTQVVLSRNVVIKGNRFAGKVGMQTYVDFIAEKVALLIESISGKKQVGKFSYNYSSRAQHVNKIEKDIDKKFKKMRSESNDDW